MSMHTLVIDSPIGPLTLRDDGEALCELVFGNFDRPVEEPSPLLCEAQRQLSEYFAGTRRAFDLPLAPRGTPFQMSVWRALLDIPYGETRSYGFIAAAVGNPKAARAVGMANNHNPISVIIPCHRVIGADGTMVGYGGGMDRKLLLLRLEQRK